MVNHNAYLQITIIQLQTLHLFNTHRVPVIVIRIICNLYFNKNPSSRSYYSIVIRK